MKIKTNRVWLYAAGIVMGAAGILLTAFGNPPNMGIGVASFLRDTAGALGFDGAGAPKYLRPEIPGLILGAFIFSVLSRKWTATRATSPLLRFVIAFFVMLGCLVFLGCPLRLALRLGAGDYNALIGLVGLIAGVFAGSGWIKLGFTLGDDSEESSDSGRGAANGLIIPILALLLLALLFFHPSFIKFSPFNKDDPGSMHAPMIMSLVAALIIGVLCVLSNFCITSSIRDILLEKKIESFKGYIAIIVAAFIGSLITEKFQTGFFGQPFAHSNELWNFLGMLLVGYGSVLIGGDPLRQLIKAGQGSADGGIAVLGFIAAGALAHNFGTVASPDSFVSGLAIKGAVPLHGQIAVIAGLVVITLIATMCRKKGAAKTSSKTSSKPSSKPAAKPVENTVDDILA